MILSGELRSYIIPNRAHARFLLRDFLQYRRMKHKIFVYGTLKRGGSNHGLLAKQNFISAARTQPHYRLYSLGNFPAMVEALQDGRSIEGEIWGVDAACLLELDQLEEVDQGVYKRVPIPLLPPHDNLVLEGYVHLKSITGLRDCGEFWPV